VNFSQRMIEHIVSWLHILASFWIFGFIKSTLLHVASADMNF
jgi:hypothetical protein